MSPRFRPTWLVSNGQRVPNDQRTRSIVDAIANGERYPDIARRHGISVARVCQIRKFAGLPKRRRERAL